MPSLYRCLLLILVASCASHQSTAASGNAQPSSLRSELIRRGTSWEDPELAAKGLGRMEVVVRVADRPAQVVNQAYISIRIVGEGTPEKKLLTNERGVVEFDSIAVGRYQLLVRAIGFQAASAEVPVLPGCRTDVEAYIGHTYVGLFPPPPEPSRIRVTTCRTSK
jgi:hypothetical protein